MSRRRQQVLLCLLLGSLLLVLLRIAWPFASSLVLAVLLATVLHPANNRLSRRLRRPGLSSLLTTLATVIVLEVIFGFVCYRVVKDAVKVQHALNQRSVDEGGWAAMVAHSTDRIADVLATRLPVSKEIARDKLDAGMKSGAHYLFSKTQVVIRNIASIVVMSVLAAILQLSPLVRAKFSASGQFLPIRRHSLLSLSERMPESPPVRPDSPD
jgi:predicted PurR-regulated permease PerM